MTLFSREWAIGSHNTFQCRPIAAFVDRWKHGVTVDPFARDEWLSTYTNDLNPDTLADYHMDALDFLKMLNEKEVKADTVIFDPPYSPRQISECYKGIGRKTTKEDCQSSFYLNLKNEIHNLVKPGGVVLCFGWNSSGMKKALGYVIEEILIVCHGGNHNDTICGAWRKNGN